VLHNFLRSKPSSRNIYSPPDYIDRKNQGIVIDAEWRQNGEVSWEWDAISNEKMCVLTRFVCDVLGTTCVRRNLSKIS
jgi:hypothetical protein